MSGHRRQRGQRVAVGVRARVRAGHGGDDSGLDHPLQVLAGCDGVDCRDKGTARSWHIYSKFLGRKAEKGNREQKRNCQ